MPANLEPEALRVELVALGDAFRAYQQRAAPDLAALSDLHERKARAFAQWAQVSSDEVLRREAERAEKSAATTREMHENRMAGQVTGSEGDGPAVVERLLTRGEAGHLRTVMAHVPAQAPRGEAAVHLAVLMLTLRAAQAGTGNVTGQDLTGWLADGATSAVEHLLTTGWVVMPGTIAEIMSSRSEGPVGFTVPSLLPDMPRPFSFGKKIRSKLSGWTQKVVTDRQLRKQKAGAATRLLALYVAAHVQPDGQLGRGQDGGLLLDDAAAFCALTPRDVAGHAELLVAAGWLTEVEVVEGQLRGRLAERSWPLGGVL
ncbi:hypothetical protein OG422_31090 (plasmid) [Streptomyces sp. NBC_01525]|uniref:hypothetical protein n=1 Tax=Streptomyces sp. NBC_01525 TaxID=2903893 RepID=UPI00386DCA90